MLSSAKLVSIDLDEKCVFDDLLKTSKLLASLMVRLMNLIVINVYSPQIQMLNKLHQYNKTLTRWKSLSLITDCWFSPMADVSSWWAHCIETSSLILAGPLST